MQNKILFAVVVHDIQIINIFEQNNKYKNFQNYIYILVGKHNQDYSSDKIIQCDRLEDNIEDNKNYLAYTGWYAVSKNIDKIPEKYEYIFFLEYDTFLEDFDSFNEMIKNIIVDNKNIYGFHKFSINSCFLDKSIFNILLVDFLKEKGFRSITTNNKFWMATNNMVFKRKILIDFFRNELTIDFLNYLKNDIMAGHNLERFLSVYCFLNNIKFDFLNPNCFKHEAMDSHNTQGRNHVYEKFKTINKISN